MNTRLEVCSGLNSYVFSSLEVTNIKGVVTTRA